MATGSIFRQLRVRDKRSIYALLRALERSRKARAPKVPASRPYREMTAEDMRKIFGGEDEGLQNRKP